MPSVSGGHLQVWRLCGGALQPSASTVLACYYYRPRRLKFGLLNSFYQDGARRSFSPNAQTAAWLGIAWR